MEHMDTPEYHQIQHYKVGDHVTVREMSDLPITTEGLPSKYDTYARYFSPVSGGILLAFNNGMQQMVRQRFVVNEVKHYPHGYGYRLRAIDTGRSYRYNFSAYMLAKINAHIKTNQQASGFLSPSKGGAR